MARETGKQRSQRIEIDYYRKRGGLHRWRTFCIAVALIGTVLYVAFVLTAGGSSHLSTGELALAHASFEDDCQQCHLDFTPMDSSGAKLDWQLVGINSADSLSHIEDACQKCHQVGDHYRSKMNAEWQTVDQNCSGCHVDHLGRDHDMLNIAAQQCVDCHGKLSDGCTGQPSVRESVTAFTKDAHGDFRSLQSGDPGKVKFDHGQHMLPGQVNEGEKGAFTLGMLDPAVRQRYRMPGQDDTAAVTLECASCHQMAGNPDGKPALVSDHELGRYLAPISFEQHCSSCHAMTPGVVTADTTPLPHAVPWAKIDLLLAATIAGARVSGQARNPRDDTQSTPQPGEGTGSGSGAENDASPLASAADVASARLLVEAQCLQCHDQQSITDEAIRSGLAGENPKLIPGRWFQRGLYDHAAHRRIDCKFCHEGAYASSVSSSPPKDQEQVMIGGIETCTPCHRDAQSPMPDSIASPELEDMDLLGGQPTWASDNCTLCHRYHTPTKGRGNPVLGITTTNGRQRELFAALREAAR